jgi:hypothetical protein
MDTRAAAYGRDAALADFKATFRQLAPYKHRYEVFRDFVTMAACALHNGLHQGSSPETWPEPAQEREQEYLSIIKAYKPDDQRAIPKLFAFLVAALDEEPRDVLGPLYMELEIASKDQGQFFAPPELSEMMARMTVAPDLVSKLEHQPFITAGEPACGAGGMILALVKVMTEAGYDPARKLWVQAIDVERMAALMCYIQLSLWNVPAEVIVGNTLSWEIREVWYTPAHHLHLWKYRLKRQPETLDVTAQPPREGQAAPGPDPAPEDPDPASTDYSPQSTPDPEERPAAPVTPSQLGFDF